MPYEGFFRVLVGIGAVVLSIVSKPQASDERDPWIRRHHKRILFFGGLALVAWGTISLVMSILTR